MLSLLLNEANSNLFSHTQKKIKFIFPSVFISASQLVSLTAEGRINKFCDLSDLGMPARRHFPFYQDAWAFVLNLFHFVEKWFLFRKSHSRTSPRVVNVIASKKKFSRFGSKRIENLMEQKCELFKHTPNNCFQSMLFDFDCFLFLPTLVSLLLIVIEKSRLHWRYYCARLSPDEKKATKALHKFPLLPITSWKRWYRENVKFINF